MFAVQMIDNDAARRLTGALRDRYRIEHEIGAGGMATVQGQPLRDIRREAGCDR